MVSLGHLYQLIGSKVVCRSVLAVKLAPSGQVFFSERSVVPRAGQGVFFRLELRRQGEGSWTPCATELRLTPQRVAPSRRPEEVKPSAKETERTALWTNEML